MSNPYSSVSISGYNVDPPSNDASEVSSNQLDWVLQHKTKLGDPLKNLAESINTNVVNAFARRLGTTFELKTTAYSIAAPGDQGKIFSVTGTTTITLPLVADAGDGFPVVVINNGSGTVTVETTVSELIDGSTSFTLAANEFALLTCDGSTWTAAISSVNTFVDTTLKVVKTADETVNNSDTLQDDDDLSVTVVSGKYYYVKAFIRITSNTGPDFKWAFTTPGAEGESSWIARRYQAGQAAHVVMAGTLFTNGQAEVIIPSATECMLVIDGTYKAAASGTFVFRWAQATQTVADTKVLESSSLLLTEVG